MNTAPLPVEALKAFEAVPDLYLILSPGLDILTASNTYLQATQTQREAIAGKKIFWVFQENPAFKYIRSIETLTYSLQQILATKLPHTMDVQQFEVPRTEAEGSITEKKYWLPQNYPVLNERGEVQYIIHKVVDVTHENTTGENLEEEYRRLRDTQTIGHIGYFERELPGNKLFWSDELYRIHGLKPQSEEITVERLLSFIHPEDRKAAEKAILHSHSTGQPLDLVHRIIRTNGEVRYVHRRAEILKNKYGEHKKVYGTVQDMTEHVIAQKKLEESDFLLRSTEGIAKTGSYEFDPVTTRCRFSDGLYRLFDEEPQSFVPTLQYVHDRTHPDDVPVIDKVFEQAVKTKQPFHYTRRIVTKNGNNKTLEVYGKVICTEGDSTVKLLGLVQDITERIKAEQDLLKHYQVLKQSEEVACMGSWEYDLATGLLHWSEGTYKLFGLPENSPVSLHTYLEYTVEEDMAVAERIVQYIKEGKNLFEETLCIKAKQQVLTLKVKGHLLRNKQGEPVRMLGVNTDLSDVKRLEQENLKLRLNQQKALLLAILDAQEKERKRISESLHNGVGQLLYATKLNMQRIAPETPADKSPEWQAFRATEKLLDNAIEETRRVSHELVPVLLHDFGLEHAIYDLCRRFNQSSLRLRCSVENLDEKLEAYLEVALYRISQELINNIVKHAKATEAGLLLRKREKQLLLRVQDNGKGFTYQPAKMKGIGLRTIKDRLKLLNGTLNIKTPKSGKGTLVTIRIPLPA